MKQQEFFELAEELEKKCGDWENSKGMSEEAKAKLIKRVEQMDREASGKIRGERRVVFLKKRYAAVLAAALMLLMGMGVVGGRAWIADSRDISRESEVTTKVNNEEKESVLYEVDAVYQEISEKLGIAPMWLGYIPEGMVLDSYCVLQSTGRASLNYLNDENAIFVQMARLSEEFSGNVQWDGKSRRLEDVANDFGYEIEAYCINEEEQNYSASLVYGNGYYSILGNFSDENEFLEILSGIYFKNL